MDTADCHQKSVPLALCELYFHFREMLLHINTFCGDRGYSQSKRQMALIQNVPGAAPKAFVPCVDTE